ncbi:hypothetical protein BN6_54050 [Saccharothrix espanaensis DSM 44229]|uniref:Uncharacterized protein n=1 Tax=Saccharothrix espanaensis (strain ATCC 51144 / DSM 44229 / JCM 9112 / NBRC 15066 / NRRL 15764) TaxID=1179773 RepID=K0K6Z6_SACES|nr:hypothetical protein BN6_54050 [Saccharothrix espanaensis DSM 44229]
MPLHPADDERRVLEPWTRRHVAAQGLASRPDRVGVYRGRLELRGGRAAAARTCTTADDHGERVVVTTPGLASIRLAESAIAEQGCGLGTLRPPGGPGSNSAAVTRPVRVFRATFCGHTPCLDGVSEHTIRSLVSVDEEEIG